MSSARRTAAVLVAGIAWLGTAVPAGADNTNSNTNDNTNTDFGAYLGVDTGSEKTNWPPTQIDWPPADITGGAEDGTGGDKANGPQVPIVGAGGRDTAPSTSPSTSAPIVPAGAQPTP